MLNNLHQCVCGYFEKAVGQQNALTLTELFYFFNENISKSVSVEFIYHQNKKITILVQLQGLTLPFFIVPAFRDNIHPLASKNFMKPRTRALHYRFVLTLRGHRPLLFNSPRYCFPFKISRGPLFYKQHKKSRQPLIY